MLWKLHLSSVFSNCSRWNILLLVHIVSKWFLCIKHLEEDYTDWPDINLARVLSILCLEDLRWQVPISTLSRSCDIGPWLITLYLFADAKVKDLDNTMMKENVSWFQIKVNNFIILFLQVFDATQHLSYDVLWLSFIQTAQSPEIAAKFRTWTILHHKAISIVGVKLIKHLHYIWMGQLSMDLDLFVQKVVISLKVLGRGVAIIWKYLDSNVLISLDVETFVDLAKASTAD